MILSSVFEQEEAKGRKLSTGQFRGGESVAYPGSRFFVATSKKRIQLLVESVGRNRNDVPFGTKAHLPRCIILEQSRGRPAE